MDINLPMDPPVNNLIQGTIYDKLDAITFEKTRVANCQLNTRLSIQEKILAKYRQDVEKVHDSQSKRLRREYKKIQDKKPDYVYDDSVIYESKRRPKDFGRPRSLSETSNNSGYCKRFYAHHYNIKDTSKSENEDTDKPKNTKLDFVNIKFKLYFLNVLNKNPCYDSHSLPQISPTNNATGNIPGRELVNDYTDNSAVEDDVGNLDDFETDVFDSSHDLSSSLDSSLIFPKQIKRSQSLAHPEIVSQDTVEKKRRQRKVKARQSLQDLSTRGRPAVGISAEDFEKRKEMWKRPRNRLDKLLPTK